MSRSLLLPALSFVFSLQAIAAGADTVNLDRIMALAKTYFRDSAEVPMDVAVTTVVTDRAGKPKRQAQSSVRMLFHGYNRQSHKLSLNGNSGMFNSWALRDSMSGNMAAFVAALLLTPGKEVTEHLEIHQPAQPGQPILVTNHPEPCPSFEIQPPGRYLFPRKPCGEAQFSLTVKPDNDLTFQQYSFDSGGLPAAAKVPYLDEVQMLTFHLDIEFQEGFLPGESNPFLWPKQTITQVTTDKGKISITNRYSPTPPKH
jgi:hypothetical protein